MVPETRHLIGHYTKIENLKYLIVPENESGKLRMSNAEYMNDPSEGKALFDFLSDGENLIDRSSCMETSENIYISCFTSLDILIFLMKMLLKDCPDFLDVYYTFLRNDSFIH